MPDFDPWPYGDLWLEPAPPSGATVPFADQLAALAAALPTTAHLLCAAIVALILIACVGTRVEQGPRR